MSGNGIREYSIWDADMREITVSPETLPGYASRYRLPARMALGRICTLEMFEKDRERIISKPLP